jgi:hypothetical protein
MLSITLKTRAAERTYPLFVNDYGAAQFHDNDRASVDALAGLDHGIAPECIESTIYEGAATAGTFDGSDAEFPFETVHFVVMLNGAPCDAPAMYAFCDAQAKL